LLRVIQVFVDPIKGIVNMAVLHIGIKQNLSKMPLGAAKNIKIILFGIIAIVFIIRANTCAFFAGNNIAIMRPLVLVVSAAKVYVQLIW
jgi:hypothetical protein